MAASESMEKQGPHGTRYNNFRMNCSLCSGQDEIERPLPENDTPQSVKLPKAVKGLSDKPEQTSVPQRVVLPRAETDLSGMAEPERVMSVRMSVRLAW